MRIAKTIILTDEERATLMQWSRGRKTPARLVLRAKIVLASGGGQENKDIAAELKCTRRTAGTWRSRRSAGSSQEGCSSKRPETRELLAGVSPEQTSSFIEVDAVRGCGVLHDWLPQLC